MRETVYVMHRGARWYLDFRWGDRRLRWSVSDKKKEAVEARDEVVRRMINGTFDPKVKPWEAPKKVEEPEAPPTLGAISKKLLKLKEAHKPCIQPTECPCWSNRIARRESNMGTQSVEYRACLGPWPFSCGYRCPAASCWKGCSSQRDRSR